MFRVHGSAAQIGVLFRHFGKNIGYPFCDFYITMGLQFSKRGLNVGRGIHFQDISAYAYTFSKCWYEKGYKFSEI